MLDELNISRAVEQIMDDLEDVEFYFIERVAEQIKAIGEMNATSINRVTIMAEMGADITDITRRLKTAMNTTEQKMMQIYQKALNSVSGDSRFKAALQHTSLTAADTARITQYAQAVSVQTAQRLTNISNTTAISDAYRAAVDKALIAVSSGLTDYRSATRQAVHDLGYNGMQVQYASGYHRRLDTAVQQNIVDGARQLSQRCSDAMGEALGYDAVEIVAHAMSAPDHEPVQGRVFLKAEFEKLQGGQAFQDIDGNQYEAIRRPIGEWNCRHSTNSFSTKYSKRFWSDEQLAELAEKNQKGCTIDGRQMTLYEASQLMRQIETEVRREKDAAVAAKAAGDDVLRRQCQLKINALMDKYYSVVAASGLTAQLERTTVEGFRSVKVN